MLWANSNETASIRPRRHEHFYFQDGNVIFQVEDVLFNVHRYFFQQHSSAFESMFLYKPAEGEPLEGSADEHPIILGQTSAQDFERLFCIMYPRGFGHYELTTTEEWTSVLRLAHMWQFDSILSLVAKQLPGVATLADQIALAREFALPGIIGFAGKRLCWRKEPLTLSETKRLGTVAAYAIGHLREGMTRNSFDQRVVNHDMTETKIMQFFESLDAM